MAEFRLLPFQDRFIFSDRRFPALVAGVGTGKTMCGIFRMMRLMQEYPNNLGIIIRKEFTDMKDSTIKDFTRYTGLDVPTSKDVVLPNGSTIMFRHGDEINVLKNINAGAIMIEQAEEFDTDETFTFLRDRLRRSEAGTRSMFIIANTNGHNWIWKTWKMAPEGPEFELTEATTFDNPNLPPDFLADMERRKKSHPHHYNRYVMNSWEDEDTVDKIIQYDWIKAAIDRKISKIYPEYKIVVCDPARYGDDETVIYVLQRYDRHIRLIDREIYNQKSTMETAGRLVAAKNRHGANMIAIDVCGLGAGIADRLDELGENVYEINSAAASVQKDKYRNIRAEMWDVAASLFQNDLVSIDNDEMLVEQLNLVRYKTIESNGKLQVQSKEEIKKELLRSPDRADALVMGLWAIDKADPVAEDVYKKKSGSKYPFNAATC
jgi:phage terminase large subunit-like protein